MELKVEAEGSEIWLIMRRRNSDIVIYMLCNNCIYVYDVVHVPRQWFIKEEVHSALSQQAIMAQSTLWEKAKKKKYIQNEISHNM